jgi:uncharacterized protein (TIGR03000 family)
MIRHLVSCHAGSALAVAVTLAMVQPAEAQMRRGWRSSGGQYGVPSGGYYPGGYYPGGYQPGYGYQGQYGVYQGGYYEMPGQYVMPSGYTPGQNMMPQYGYGQQQTMMPQYGYNQQYATMGTQPLGNAARVTVRLPADARLWIDDFQFQQTGPVRVLNTPELQPGQKYHYVLKAQWTENGQPVTQERTANVQAGGETTVDFAQAAPKAAAEAIGAPAARPNPSAPAPLPAGTPPARPDGPPA